MVNMRIDDRIVKAFDDVAKRHSRDRTKELRHIMLKAIREEFPDFKDPEQSF